MTALKEIIEKYRKMSDRELSDLYEFEIADLLPEARGELVAELRRRNIFPQPTDNFTENVQSYTPSRDLTEILYNFLESGWSKKELFNYTAEKGLNEEECNKTMEVILAEIKAKIKKSSVSITNGILICAIGLGVRSLPLNTERFWGLIVLCYCATAIGIMKALHGYFLQNKLRKLERKLASNSDDSCIIS